MIRSQPSDVYQLLCIGAFRGIPEERAAPRHHGRSEHGVNPIIPWVSGHCLHRWRCCQCVDGLRVLFGCFVDAMCT